MTAKEYLNQARLLDQRINTKLERVARLRSLTERVTAASGAEPVSHSRNVTSLQDQIIRLMEEEESLNAQIDQLVDLKAEITEKLNMIQDMDGRLLLEMRYLCCRDWEEIATVMHVHLRTAHKIHSRALQKMETVMGQVN